ncbi:tripartite tricarboxylate transporter substrate binding protein [Alkalibacillus haloalkaliphilus]|uniref:tripartite tricarboxylate transporter substrate binding protein n=1 Tax=Alkalibacillus haloalkaliphilus TaxID=94136 RepID=UPI0002D8B47D|nr:tripartite tricarboxylate transporter substrate binding protein [Alkalibacillus haloalkaliphilus]
MKKLLAGSIFAFMLLILAACGGDDQAADEGNNGEPQDWEPEESIELVAPAGAGGGWDTTARMTAQTLTEEGIIDQDIGVVNKPGAGGAVGWAHIANQGDSPYDLFVSSSPLLLVPLNGQSDYNFEDFTPIANVIADYASFAVRDDAEWEDLNDLFDDMKEDPSEITVVGTSAPGSMDHIQFIRFAREAGVDISQISYVSDPDAGGVTQLLNGSADVFSTGVGQIVEQIRSEDIRALAVTSEERLEGEILSEIPTAKEQGIDETFVNWRGIFGPGDMDDAAVEYYEEKLKEMSETEAFADVRDNYGWDEMFMGSEEYQEFLEQENEVFKEILDELELSAE